MPAASSAGSERFRQRVRGEGEARDDAKRAAATALERPEQVGLAYVVDDAAEGMGRRSPDVGEVALHCCAAGTAPSQNTDRCAEK
jgi:hypothetical protein